MRLVYATIATLLSLIGMLVTTPANVRALPENGNTDIVQPQGSIPLGYIYYIQNRGSGKCLDQFTDGLGTRGNEVGMFDCHGASSERWDVVSSGHPNYPYKFRNSKSGQCLTVAVMPHPYTMDSCTIPAQQSFDTQAALSGGTFILYVNDPSGDSDILLDEYQSYCCQNGSPVGNFTFANDALQRWNFIRAF